MPVELDASDVRVEGQYAFTSDRALANEVHRCGWLRLRGSNNSQGLESEILRVARSLGEPLAGRNNQVLEMLAPTRPEHSKANSLSERHGLGAFPLHVDGAHRPRPPRFLVLGCASAGASPIPTLVSAFDDLKLDAVDLRRCATAIFVIRNGRRSFYSTITDLGQPFVRFDAGCMKAVSAEARVLSDKITSRSDHVAPTRIDWQTGEIVILDNWRVLHGRGASPSAPSLDRLIFRVAVQCRRNWCHLRPNRRQSLRNPNSTSRERWQLKRGKTWANISSGLRSRWSYWVNPP